MDPLAAAHAVDFRLAHVQPQVPESGRQRREQPRRVWCLKARRRHQRQRLRQERGPTATKARSPAGHIYGALISAAPTRISTTVKASLLWLSILTETCARDTVSEQLSLAR